MTEFEQLPLLQIPHPQLLLPQVVEELSVEAILQQKSRV